MTLWRTRIACWIARATHTCNIYYSTYCFSTATMVARTCLGVIRTLLVSLCYFLFCGTATQRGPMASSFLRFRDHTQLRTTVGRTPLDERPARRIDLYLTTDNTDKGQTSMPPVGFEPTVPASKLQQTHALERAVTGTGLVALLW
jgi:hypothetical protein